MRTFSVFAVSLISIMLAAGPALADPKGFVSGSGGPFGIQLENVNIDGAVADVRGSITHAITPVLNVQGDVVLEYKQLSFDVNTNEFVDLSGAVHLFYREPERFLAGGFAQIDGARINFYNNGAYQNSFTFSRGLVGVEGQLFLDDVTLYGQAGLMRENFGDDYVQNGVFVAAQVRYFLTPDLKVDAHGLLSRVGDEYHVTTAGIGAGVEYRLPESPLSLFGSADVYRTEGDIQAFSDTRVMVGLKFNFGSDSLKDQDRNGTSLNPFPSRPFNSAQL